MERKIETRYTDSALEQLEKFKFNQLKMLKERIVADKSYPGADFIEITGADIQDYSKDIVTTRPKSKSSLKYLIIYIYFIIGLGLMLFGLFYNDLMEIINNQPKQAIYILTGLVMTILSGILLFYTRYRERRVELILREKERFLDQNRKSLEEYLKVLENEINKAEHS